MATTASDDGEQLYCFEDIPLYVRVYYRGRPGYVTDKGPDVSNHAEGEHIEVKYEIGHNRSTAVLHERVVNRSLREQQDLWVDFGHRLDRNIAEEH